MSTYAAKDVCQATLQPLRGFVVSQSSTDTTLRSIKFKHDFSRALQLCQVVKDLTITNMVLTSVTFATVDGLNSLEHVYDYKSHHPSVSPDAFVYVGRTHHPCRAENRGVRFNSGHCRNEYPLGRLE